MHFLIHGQNDETVVHDFVGRGERCAVRSPLLDELVDGKVYFPDFIVGEFAVGLVNPDA